MYWYALVVLYLSLMVPQHALDVTSLSKRLETGELSAFELMKATLDKIERINPKVNAIISLRDRKDLLEEALQADQVPRKGWLHGIPIAIKDLSNCKGIPTTMGGSPLYQEDCVPLQSDPFVQRLVDQGAIVIGKTNTPESGLGSHTYNKQWGPTRNPYDLSRSSGGSSGGAAVAVATGLLSFADGSDMMGSLRNPAGWNSLYSMRPTAGMFEFEDTDRNPLCYPISTVGPITRTPRDLAQCLEAMAGSDRFQSALVQEETDVDGMRIAWLGDWGGVYPTEEGVLPLCRKALSVFSAVGVQIKDVEEPLFSASKLWKSWTTIRSAVVSASEIAAHGEVTLRQAGIRPELQWEIERGLAVSDGELAEAGVIAQEWSDCLEELFTHRYDAIALPSAQVWPFPVEWHWPKNVAGRDMDTYHRWMENVVPASLAGLPCVTIPAGFGCNGLPMGVQIATRRGGDAKLLRLANAYHEANDWTSRQTLVSSIEYE